MKNRRHILICLFALALIGTSCIDPSGFRIQKFYGKVVDQYGQPVVGADVKGSVVTSQGFDVDEKYKYYYTKTDSNGLFQFTWWLGSDISPWPSKPGYELGDSRTCDCYQGPLGKTTSPADRATFIMWKLKGPEPMIHRQKFYKINPDGRTFTIDFFKREIIEGFNSTGDFLIRIQRPAIIGPQERFNWSFVMIANGGGFIEITNKGYLNEAPESGYLPQYSFSMSTDDEEKNWKKNAYNRYVSVEKAFYIKSRNGRIYGHFNVEIHPYYHTNISAMDIEYYINPFASRNLEWDGDIQLTDSLKPLLRR